MQYHRIMNGIIVRVSILVHRKIIGSVHIDVKADTGNLLSIRHLIIEGSSGLVIGRNITRPCDIKHIGGNARILLKQTGDKIYMVDVKFHIYTPIEKLKSPKLSPLVAGISAASSCIEKGSLENCAKVKRVVDLVKNTSLAIKHFLTCGFYWQGIIFEMIRSKNVGQLSYHSVPIVKSRPRHQQTCVYRSVL